MCAQHSPQKPQKQSEIKFKTSDHTQSFTSEMKEYKWHRTKLFRDDIMSRSVTLEMIYDEVKKMNERLRLIEDVIEEVLIKSLPTVELSKQKTEEIEHSIQHMKKGNYITLEELESA